MNDRITIQCPACNAKLAVASQHAGKRLKCPKCKVEVLVPQTVAKRETKKPPILGYEFDPRSAETTRTPAAPPPSNGETQWGDPPRPLFKSRSLWIALCIAVLVVIPLIAWVGLQYSQSYRLNDYRSACVNYFERRSIQQQETVSKAKLLLAESKLKKDQLAQNRYREYVRGIGAYSGGSSALREIDGEIKRLNRQAEDLRQMQAFRDKIGALLADHDKVENAEILNLKAVQKDLRLEDADCLEIRESVKKDVTEDRMAIERELESLKNP